MSQTALEAFEGFTFGCDPEMFILDEGGRPVSADGLLPGTKNEPYKVKNGAVQVDGMAAEFNIDPVDNFFDFNNNITSVIRQMKGMLPKGYSLSVVPSITFDEEVWGSAPSDAKELGCSPDFNAWEGNCNPPPSCPDNPRMRTASGHLHIGWTFDADLGDLSHILNCQDLVKQLDWYLGGWSLSVDKDAERRRLYGKAGACRYKDYGVEYRVLSNFWLTSKERRLSVWNRMNQAIFDMRNLYMPERAGTWNKDLISSINTSTRNRSLEQNFSFLFSRI